MYIGKEVVATISNEGGLAAGAVGGNYLRLYGSGEYGETVGLGVGPAQLAGELDVA